MIFLESSARKLLLLHAVGAAVLVGAATHHLIWTLRNRKTERFAAILAIAWLINLSLGLMLYPTYRVRVRAEYFDNPAAIRSFTEVRTTHALGRLPLEPGKSLPAVARLFDIKEHWVAVGGVASMVLWLMARKRVDRSARALYVGLAVLAFATGWIGALVGLYTVSHRAVGGG